MFPAVFFLLGCTLIPYPGIQNDEALFAAADFQTPGSSIFDVRILHHQIPIMHLTYLGALKTWLYAPILHVFPSSYWTLRLPVLLLGAVSIGLFMRLLQMLHSRRAAWIGGLLLATDTMYLVTTCFDWGPVVLQHLLLIAGALLILSFLLQGRRSSLFIGFLCFGLCLWDKALFVWILAGLFLATLAIFARELWTRLSPLNLGLAAAGFCLGALPLILYNFESGFPTFRSNSHLVLDKIPEKAAALQRAWNGSSLLGYITSEPEDPGEPHEAHGAIERVSFALHTAFSDHATNRLVPAFWLSVLLFPLWWTGPGRRVLLFSLVAIATAWLMMALTKDGGGAAHHTVLLWPLGHAFMAVAFAEISLWPRTARGRRIAGALLAGLTLYLVACNLLVTNQYLYQLARFGSRRSWTDAIYSLSHEVGRLHPSQIVVDDWGIINPLILLHGGKLPLIWVDDGFLSPTVSGDAREWGRRVLEQGLWIGHTAAYEEIAGLEERIVHAAHAAGYRKNLIETVPDTHGRPAFELFRFVGPN